MQSRQIAKDYESFLSDHPLFKLDVQLVQTLIEDRLQSSEKTSILVADLGCGTGRVARECANSQVRFLNIDLSQAMLQESVRLSTESTNYAPIRANLAELSFLRDGCLDLAVCLFSSIGMIRERRLRIAMLQATRQALKTNGPLLLHVHNRWQSLWDPNGLYWLMRSFIDSVRGRSEFGDRVYAYRGLPSMFLHIYGFRELQRDLRASGFQRYKITPISGDGSQTITNTPLNRIRCGGFFAVAHA